MRAGTFGWLGLLLVIGAILSIGLGGKHGPWAVFGGACIAGACLCFIRSAKGDDD